MLHRNLRTQPFGPAMELAPPFELRQSLTRLAEHPLDLVEQPLVGRAAAHALVAFDLIAKPGSDLLELHIPPTNEASIRCTFERRMRNLPSRLDF
jgi:hypothetical protein